MYYGCVILFDVRHIAEGVIWRELTLRSYPNDSAVGLKRSKCRQVQHIKISWGYLSPWMLGTGAWYPTNYTPVWVIYEMLLTLLLIFTVVFSLQNLFAIPYPVQKQSCPEIHGSNLFFGKKVSFRAEVHRCDLRCLNQCYAQVTF